MYCPECLLLHISKGYLLSISLILKLWLVRRYFNLIKIYSIQIVCAICHWKGSNFCPNELLKYEFWTFENLNHLVFTEIGSSSQAKCRENVIWFPLIQPTDKSIFIHNISVSYKTVTWCFHDTLSKFGHKCFHKIS